MSTSLGEIHQENITRKFFLKLKIYTEPYS